MPTKEISQPGTLFFDEGAVGVFHTKKGDGNSVGEQLLFYPSIMIDSYSVSRTEKRIFKHILCDIYDVTFRALAKYQHNDRPSGYYKYKDLNHYLIEVTPGFSAFHYNWTKVSEKYLQLGKLYRGYCRLTTCFNPSSDNANIDSQAIKRTRCKGFLEEIQVNQVWREYSRQMPPPKCVSRDIAYKDCGVISYEDALKYIGYPGDELKFRVKVAEYQGLRSTIKSSDKKRDSDRLVYRVRMKWPLSDPKIN